MPCISRREHDAGRAARIGRQSWNFDYDLLLVFNPTNFQEPRHFVHFRLLCRWIDTSEVADYEAFCKENRIHVVPSSFSEHSTYRV